LDFDAAEAGDPGQAGPPLVGGVEGGATGGEGGGGVGDPEVVQRDSKVRGGIQGDGVPNGDGIGVIGGEGTEQQGAAAEVLEAGLHLGEFVDDGGFVGEGLPEGLAEVGFGAGVVALEAAQLQKDAGDEEKGGGGGERGGEEQGFSPAGGAVMVIGVGG